MPRKFTLPEDEQQLVTSGPTGRDAWRHWESRTYEMELVTPMYGGGVDVGSVDELTPISSKAIRGHLRHWWRLCCGNAFLKKNDIESLSRRETEVFGSSDSDSPLQVDVVRIDDPEDCLGKSRRSKSDRVPFDFPKYGPEAYALFPLREPKDDGGGDEAWLCREGLRFTLTVRWPKANLLRSRRIAESAERKKQGLPPLSDVDTGADIESALWAWANFGGIGARTRRGLGAIHCPELAVDDPRFAAARQQFAQVATVLRGPPYANQGAPLTAWRRSLEAYVAFRQTAARRTKTVVRQGNKKTVPEGRSFWPEPDAIRRESGCHLDDARTGRKHAPFTGSEATPDAFPRGLLGMPIIFSFVKDGPGKERRTGKKNPPNHAKDPCDAELVPGIIDEMGNVKHGTRLASPVITRPLFLDGKWYSGVVVLRTPGQDNLQAYLRVWKLGKSEPELVKVSIDDPKLNKVKPMKGKRNILEAIQVFLRTKGFKPYTISGKP